MENKKNTTFKVVPSTKPISLYTDEEIKNHNLHLKIMTFLFIINVIIFYALIFYIKLTE